MFDRNSNYFFAVVDHDETPMGFCAVTGEVAARMASSTGRIPCHGGAIVAIYPVSESAGEPESPVKVPPEESVETFDDWTAEDILDDEAFSEAAYRVAPWESRRSLRIDQFRPTHLIVKSERGWKQVFVPFEKRWSRGPEHLRLVFPQEMFE